MRNYVIINGVSSLTIEGLAINIMPPITKPLMRNEIEEIDGRDGDIITELGYSAYDKEMEIGLWGNYDIDEIIKFFTGEGTVIFSTEPDKYYNFKILNQIDYDKLLKFRNATVVFHCQPFKYPTNEEPIEVEPVVKTGEGETITIDDTFEGSLQMLLKGNTSQANTILPSGYTQVDYIQSSGTQYIDTGYQITAVSQSYSAILDAQYLSSISRNAILISSDVNSWMGQSNGYYALGSSAKSNVEATTRTTLNVSFGTSSVLNVNGETITREVANQVGNVKLFGISPYGSSAKIYRAKIFNSSNVLVRDLVPCFRNSDNVIGMYDLVNNLFYTNAGTGTFTKGDNSTLPNPTYPQEVHTVSGDNEVEVSNGDNTQRTTYPINLPEGMFLGSIGDYKDRFFKTIEGDSVYDSLDSTTKASLTSGMWYLQKNVGKVVLDGSESWIAETSGNYATNPYFRTGNSTFITTYQNIMSNYFIGKNISATTTGGIQKSANLLILQPSNGILTASDFKTWLETHNTIVYAPLITPTYTKIEGTLASQLEEVYRAKSEEGQTNISQTNNDLPFWISATITFTPPSTINNIGNIYAKPILTITGSGNVGVVLNGIEILQINLGEGNTIAIDVPNLEAYNPNDNTLMNRLVTGDYMKLLIQEGNNSLSFDGDVTSYSMTNYTRWI